MNAKLHLAQVRLSDPEAAPLLAGLAEEYHTRYGSNQEMSRASTGEFDPPAGLFLVVLDGTVTAAGGGFRRHAEGACEVKRMWTDPAYRRRGLADRVLGALEEAAARAGYTRLVLETGPAQPEAARLYGRRGYARIPAYGHYPEALAFSLDLPRPAPGPRPARQRVERLVSTGVNENHKYCGSDEWRKLVRESLLPWALGDTDLGDDVLEVGPGYGATTDVLAGSVARLTAVEIDPELAEMLTARFAAKPSVSVVNADATALRFPDGRFSGAASFTMLHHVPTAQLQDRLFSEVARVLRPGAAFVAGDGLASPEQEAGHEGDTYNPLDPDGLPARLESAGFTKVTLRTSALGWSARAVKA